VMLYAQMRQNRDYSFSLLLDKSKLIREKSLIIFIDIFYFKLDKVPPFIVLSLKMTRKLILSELHLLDFE